MVLFKVYTAPEVGWDFFMSLCLPLLEEPIIGNNTV